MFKLNARRLAAVIFVAIAYFIQTTTNAGGLVRCFLIFVGKSI